MQPQLWILCSAVVQDVQRVCSFSLCCLDLVGFCRQYLLEAEGRALKLCYFSTKSFGFRDKLDEEELSSCAPLKA